MPTFSTLGSIVLSSAVALAQMSGAKVPVPHNPGNQTASQPRASKEPLTPVPGFEDIARTAGLTVSHISSPEKKYIVESMSGGAARLGCAMSGGDALRL